MFSKHTPLAGPVSRFDGYSDTESLRGTQIRCNHLRNDLHLADSLKDLLCVDGCVLVRHYKFLFLVCRCLCEFSALYQYLFFHQIKLQ